MNERDTLSRVPGCVAQNGTAGMMSNPRSGFSAPWATQIYPMRLAETPYRSVVDPMLGLAANDF